jgi:hypothetical protein
MRGSLLAASASPQRGNLQTKVRRTAKEIDAQERQARCPRRIASGRVHSHLEELQLMITKSLIADLRRLV